MTLPLTLSVILSGMTASPAQACSPAGPDARVHVSFLADSDLVSLVKWAKEMTCVDYTFDSSLAVRRMAQGVILTVTGRDVGNIFEILLHTMNLRSKARGAKRVIVANGPETEQSRTANEKEKADLDREKVLANIETEIKKKDESHYVVSRKGADAILANITSIARSIRAVPESKNGKPAGYRLSALKPTSILARLGFQNGDLVQALNGNNLTAPDKALDAYGKFRTTGLVHATFTRMGKPLTIEVKIE
jgi:type II secretory pathway component PulC